MIIIVEGSNKVGKSTFINELKYNLELNGKVVHLINDRLVKNDYEYDGISRKNTVFSNEFIKDSITNKLFDRYKLISLLNEQHPEEYFIFDRFHITEYVYGMHYRDYRNDAMLELDKMLSENKDVKMVFISSNYIHIDNEQERSKYVSLQNSFFHFPININNDVYRFHVTNEDDVKKYVHAYCCKRLHIQTAPKYIPKIYFASPFFNPEQVEREERLKKLLRDNDNSVYSPKEDAIITLDSTQEKMEEVFRHNVENITSSDCVFAVTDGKDIGTIWEAGYAFGIDKPVIYYCETLGDNPFNIMLGKSGVAIYTSYEDLSKDLEECDIFDIICGEGKRSAKNLKGF